METESGDSSKYIKNHQNKKRLKKEKKTIGKTRPLPKAKAKISNFEKKK